MFITLQMSLWQLKLNQVVLGSTSLSGSLSCSLFPRVSMLESHSPGVQMSSQPPGANEGALSQQHPVSRLLTYAGMYRFAT